jgi:diaminopimelate dehydrogenase
MKIGIVGYGNLGQGVESALRHTGDMELAAVFTRRNPENVSIRTAGAPVLLYSEMEKMKGKIDVMILCGGSATDLPVMTPEIAAHFHLVDSFDTHANIPAHFAAVDAAAKKAGTVAVISSGWDPGIFSVNRLYANAILPQGKDYTFWGKGLSQGHSDAIRRIPGVLDARQYTVPIEAALQRVRTGENPSLTTREKHTRECFVVAEAGADRESITRTIKTMPNYFADYNTSVTFITQEELNRDHGHTAHGGYVFRSGKTGWENDTTQTIEYRLTLGSNPEFTASVLVATARGVFRLAEQGQSGCKTLFDLPPASLSPLSGEELRAALL